MLLLDSEFRVGDLTCHADHVSPTTFHVLPGPPRLLSTPGRPGAQLLRYRGRTGAGSTGHRADGPGTVTGEPTSAIGGGALTIDLHLGVDTVALEEARRVLSRRARADVSLVPVTFSEGRVRLTLVGVQSRATTEGTQPASFLVERVLGVATPSLFGHAHAIFSIDLTVEGATMIEQALRERTLPLAVAYDLTFEGLRLARGLTARVEYRMAYDYLRSRAAANTLLFRADLDREAEALRREQLITIEDVDYTGSDPQVLAARAEEIRRTLHELMEGLFFRPATSPAALPPDVLAAQPALASAWTAGAGGHVAFVLRDLVQREDDRLEYDLTSTRVARRSIAPQGSLTALDGFAPELAILDVDLTERRPRHVRVVVPSGADWTGIAGIETTLQTAGDTAPLADALRPDRTDVVFHPPDGELRYRTRVLVDPDPEALGHPSTIESAWLPLPAETIVLDPASLAERRVLTVTMSTTDDGGRVRVRGALSAESASRPFVLDRRRPSVTVPVWGRVPLRLAAAVEIDAVVVATENRSIEAGERVLVVNPPLDRAQRLIVELVDPLNRFESVFVEVEAASGGGRRQVRLDASTPRQDSTVVVPIGSPRGYRYRIRYVFRDARTVDLPWREGMGQLLLVGDTNLRLVSVDVVLLRRSSDTLAIELTVTSLAPPPGVPAATTLVVEEGARALALVPFGADERPRYRVTGRLFTEAGERAVGPVIGTGEVCLVDVG